MQACRPRRSTPRSIAHGCCRSTTPRIRDRLREAGAAKLRGLKRLAFLAAIIGGATPAAAEPFCRGTDLVPGLQVSAPKLHAEIGSVVRSTANGQALLWRINRPTGSAGAAPSWLFGTIHLTDPRVTALSPAVEAALGAARTLALELEDLGPGPMRKAAEENPAYFRPMPDRDTRKSLGPSELRALEAAVAQASSVPAGETAHMRPWFLSTLLALPSCEQARQASGLAPLDERLAQRARSTRKRVVGLETIGSQMKAMATLSAPTEIAWLRNSIALAPRIEDLTETLVQLYLGRKLAATWALSQGLSGDARLPDAALAELQDALVARRNRGMVEAATPLLEAGSVMIAVGALHLPGDDGLVRLLRDRGFTVEAIE